MFFFCFFFICLSVSKWQEEKKAHIVAVGYGRKKKIKRKILEEIGEDNVLIIKRKRGSGYGSYASQIKDMVCGKSVYSEFSHHNICISVSYSLKNTHDSACIGEHSARIPMTHIPLLSNRFGFSKLASYYSCAEAA